MANELDEMTGPTIAEGHDVNVIAKQLPVTCGGGTKFFVNFAMWLLPPLIGGIITCVKKVKAKQELLQLQQKIQQAASTIDNYLEQRVQILSNAAPLLEKALKLDKETFTEIAALRSGKSASGDEARNELSAALDNASRKINVAFENYPNLKSQNTIVDVMQQNSNLQKEITAARELYNDVVNAWNTRVYEWPWLNYAAAKQGYTTRIPFIASQETKAAARSVFFK